jgi:alpha/beta superfamily hydrolase
VKAIAAADGVTLESQWDLPESLPERATVLCHPHPLHGGTMNAPLIRAVAASLVDDGQAVLRFNFRGVGASAGGWGGGIDEMHDVAGAVDAAIREFAGLPIGLAGWSFGAMTSLRWQAVAGSDLPWAGIAPPISLTAGGDLPDPEGLGSARRLFLIGDRDQFTAADELRRYADRAGADFVLLPGSDHFFYFRERRVGDLVAAHLAGRSHPEHARSGGGSHHESAGPMAGS